MTYDVLTRVSNNQVLAGAPSGLALSESSINLLNGGVTSRIIGRDIATGKHLAFRLYVNTAFDGGAGNLAISVAFTTDAALLSGNFIPSLTIPNAALVAGREFDVPIPRQYFSLIGGVAPQYLGLFYAASGGAIATGAVSAWIPLGDTPGVPRRFAGNFTGP